MALNYETEIASLRVRLKELDAERDALTDRLERLASTSEFGHERRLCWCGGLDRYHRYCRTLRCRGIQLQTFIWLAIPLEHRQSEAGEKHKREGLASSLDRNPSYSPSRRSVAHARARSSTRRVACGQPMTAALRWLRPESGNPARENSGERSCRIIIFLL